VQDANEAKGRRDYDKTQKAGADAVALLEGWKSGTTEDVAAPWRMTAGAGGSEFGKPKWVAVLKGGFKTAEDPPKFKLWQLALADHVVRASAVIYGVVGCFVHHSHTVWHLLRRTRW
jgi:hypothetical protein